ncbi:MAG: hypothetical protein ACHQ53_00205 [Polyangiales bacterium]
MSSTPSMASRLGANAVGLVALLLAGSGCGGGAATGKPTTPAVGALPPLPGDPLRLVPAGARTIARLDLDALRASPHFATLQDWASRFVCLSAPGSQTLLRHTRGVIVAGLDTTPPSARPHGVALLAGDFSAGDARQALSEACSYTATQCGAVVERPAGRFSVLHAGELSAAPLGDHVLAVGEDEAVTAVLEVADGKRAAEQFSAEVVRGLDTRQWLAGHTLAFVTRLDDRVASRIGQELQGVGGAALGDGLANGAAAFGLALAQDASAEARVAYAEPAAADRGADSLRSLVGQAGFVMRLMGIPPLLDHLEVGVQAGLLRLGLRLSAEDVNSLRNQLMPLFEGKQAVCHDTLAALDSRNAP